MLILTLSLSLTACRGQPVAPPEHAAPRLVGAWGLDPASEEARTLTGLGGDQALRTPELEQLRQLTRQDPTSTLAARVSAAQAAAAGPLLRVDPDTLTATDADGDHVARWQLQPVEPGVELLITEALTGGTTRSVIRWDGVDRLRIRDERGGDTLTLMRL